MKNALSFTREELSLTTRFQKEIFFSATFSEAKPITVSLHDRTVPTGL